LSVQTASAQALIEETSMANPSISKHDMSKPKGKFVWYELMTTNVPAAEAFYHDVIGWTAADSGLPGKQYSVLSAGAIQVGGMMKLSQEMCDAGARPAWIGYVAVDNVDDAAAQLAQAGGTLHRGPEDIPGVGRFAAVADPQGAVFLLFRGNSDAQPARVEFGTPGHVGWHELMANELDSAFAFYAAQFGWTKAEAVDMGPMGLYQTFATGDVPVGGMMKRPPEVPMSFWTYYFNVNEINSAIARVREGGGKILNGPMQVPGGLWIAQCLDPQGAMFAMLAPGQS
jgi:predicted enzyme related to lactoylglutathione lyase